MTSDPPIPPDLALRIDDASRWAPIVAGVLERHGLVSEGRPVIPGWNPTWPTFLCGDVVVKLFGGRRAWRRAYAAERDAHARVATDRGILAPRVLAEGRLARGEENPWPYLVTARLRGRAWKRDALTAEERRTVARDLGEQVRRLHALPVDGAVTYGDWDAFDVTAAAECSSLPPHLVDEVEAFVATLGPDDPVLVHADLIDQHVFVDAGRLAGIIDWGDALAADRHLELIQPYRGLFDCDAELFRVFLDAADWPVGEDFVHRALGHALRRQAVGLAQHRGMDVFEPVAARFPLAEVPTLDALADLLFAPGSPAGDSTRG